ncbi:MAG: hypothetical protein SFV23_03105 [Planctomycetaceae bacterium]|nr:hypothetical protein [Planctomycetaceae bacterium]
MHVPGSTKEVADGDPFRNVTDAKEVVQIVIDVAGDPAGQLQEVVI